jgi:methylated-DNA-[protein]-cysteine S-methyltransferase
MNHCYQIGETAFGVAAVAFADPPFTIVDIKLPRPDPDRLCRTFEECGWLMDQGHAAAAAVVQTLADYFKGLRIVAPWSAMDISRFSAAQQAVYRAVADIPYGQTASYGQIARMAGLPRAARFVGTTMANNPYPVFIPCHRVIKSDGTLGGFGGGQALKRRMLALEATHRREG